MNEIETLKLNYEFKNVFNKGKYFIGKQVIVYIYKNKKKQNRIGIAISSKTGWNYYYFFSHDDHPPYIYH